MLALDRPIATQSTLDAESNVTPARNKIHYNQRDLFALVNELLVEPTVE